MRYLIALLALISTSAAAQSGSCRIWDGQGTFAGVGASGLAVNAQGSTLNNIQISADNIDTTTGLIETLLDGTINSNRTDVSPISGQTGVAGGSGVVSATTQRVTLATDVPLPTGSNVIGALTANQSVNQTQINGNAVSTGNGVVGTGVQRVAIASDNTAFTVNAAQSGTWTVQPGNTANTTPWLVSDNAITTGGYTPYTFGALVDTVQTVKGSAGTLGGWFILNSAATVCYVQFFDTTGAVTLGTTTPTFSLGLPAGAAANIPASRPGIAFSKGLKIAATTTRAGSTACGTEVDVNLWYK